MPSFATDVTGGETCDTDVLNTDTGPVNLRAEFEPETINLRWYNNNTLLDTTSTNSNTCTYDTAINLPADPVKPGYKFKGWKVQPEYDFSTLGNSFQGSQYGHGNDLCCHGNHWECNSSMCTTNTEFKEIQLNEWKLFKSGTGTLYGISKCSGQAGNNYSYAWNGDNSNYISTTQHLDSANGTKEYCWCNATGFKPLNSSITNRSSSVLPWVFYRKIDGTAVCAQYCPYLCAIAIDAYDKFFQLLKNP